MKLFKALREQYIEMLLEDRIDFLKQQFKDKLDTEHDTLAKHKDSDKIIDHFSKRGDPSAGKTYTQWILNQYRDKAIRQEDAPAIKNTLADFEKVKSKLEKKDINQYKDVGELRDAVATQIGNVEKEIKAKKKKETEKGAELPTLYNEDGVTGHKIPNKNASIALYGPGGKACTTSWCTAANSSNNMFNHYKGGKYTMHFPNGEVLQFHHQSGQIMDKHDRPIQENDPRFAPYAKHIDKFLRQTEAEETGDKRLNHKFRTFSPEEVQHHIDAHEKYREENPNSYRNPHRDNVDAVAKSGPLTDNQFHKLIDISKDPGLAWGSERKMLDNLKQNPHLTDSQIKHIIDTPDTEYGSSKEVLGNPALKGKNLDTLVDRFMKKDSEYNSPLGQLALHNPNLTKEHIDKMMTSKDSGVLNSLAANHGINLPKEHQEKLLNNDAANKASLIDRPDIHPDIVNHLINDKNTSPLNLRSLTENPHVNLNKEQINKVIGHPSYNSMMSDKLFNSHHEGVDDEARNKIIDHVAKTGGLTDAMMKSKNFTSDHVNKLLNSAAHNAETQRKVAASPKINSDQLHQLIDKHGEYVHTHVLANKKAKPEHLKKIIDQSPSEYRYQEILDHPATNSDVLHHMMSKGNDLVKGAALHHPAVQPQHFQNALDHGIKMHGAISSSPSAPPSVLDKLADSPLSYVRQNVAEHRNTSNDTLGKLKNDSVETVSNVASKRFKG